MLGNCEIDQVSLMFISEHANAWDAWQILQILFFNNPNKFLWFFKFVYLNVYSITWIPVCVDLRLNAGSFSRTLAGNRASSENRSKESSKEV